MSADVMINPDCRDGKHRSCSGDGWNMITDETTQCPCTCHEDAS